MKLADLDIIVTAPPAPGWGGRYWILVKVTTDTGITGWGECYASTIGPEAMKSVIRDVFERHMDGIAGRTKTASMAITIAAAECR